MKEKNSSLSPMIKNEDTLYPHKRTKKKKEINQHRKKNYFYNRQENLKSNIQ